MFVVIFIAHIEIHRVFTNIYSSQLLVVNNDKTKLKSNQIKSD